VFATPQVVIPRESGVSSTPQLFDSSTGVSGILDHPPSRVMTARGRGAFAPATDSVFKRGCFADTHPHSRGTFCPGHASITAQIRAWGMPGAQCTRSLVWVKKPHELVTTSPPESPGIPARDGVNGCFVLSSEIGLSCLRHLADTSAKLDTGVEAPGPHDFAVRRKAPSSLAQPASTASRPAFRDVAQRPSVGRDEGNIGEIWLLENRNIFARWTGQGKSR
jgi:hypothetical protein